MSDFRFFDIHSHLSFPDFDKDRDEVIKKTLDEGGGIIIVGTSAEDSKSAVEIASKYERGVYASVGLHPGAKEDFNYDYFLELAKKEKVVAIGECGLEYFHIKDEAVRQRQKEIFKKHIELALETDKPLIIHCRDAAPATLCLQGGQAHEEMIEILSIYSPANGRNHKLRGNIHFFTGSLEQAQKYFKLGFSISFTGVITFPPQKQSTCHVDCEQTVNNYSQRGRLTVAEIIKNAPLDKIMAETDSPFVAPIPYRGKRNEPIYTQEVIKKIAEIKGISYESAAKATTENAEKLFLRV